MDAEFNQKIGVAQDQLRVLLSQIDQLLPDEREIAVKAGEALSQSLEDLQVTEEELTPIQEALEVEQQRHQKLFAFAPGGHLITDAEGVIQEANRTAAQFLGVQQDQLVGEPLVLFVMADERDGFQAKVNRLRAGTGKQREHWETRFESQDGDLFHAAITVASVPDGELHWLVQDITARKQAEETFRESKERFHTVSELISDYAYAVHVEEDGSLTLEWATEGFTEDTDCELSRKITDAHNNRTIYPDDAPILQQRVQTLLSNQEDVRPYYHSEW